MDDLLEALREGDQEKINQIARTLFLTRFSGINKAQINEFERYAPCNVLLLRTQCGDTVLGAIQYNDKTYML